MKNKQVGIIHKAKNEVDDEWYTLEQEVQYLYSLLPKGVHKIWCPFDSIESNFVKYGIKLGHEVIHSSSDFFKEKWPQDAILISNIPFSIKSQIYDRLVQENKPFIILSGLWGSMTSGKFLKKIQSQKWNLHIPTYAMWFLRPKQQKMQIPMGYTMVLDNLNPTNSLTFFDRPNLEDKLF